MSPLLMKYGRLIPSLISQSSQKQRKIVSIAIYKKENIHYEITNNNQQKQTLLFLLTIKYFTWKNSI